MKICFTRYYDIPGAVRTAGAAACPVIDHCLPLMSLVANPPDLFIAAWLAVTRPEVSILFVVPFFDEIWI